MHRNRSNPMIARHTALPLIAAIALLSAPAAAAPAASPDSARQQLQQAERDRAARLAAQEQAAARARAAQAEQSRLAAERVAAAARLRQAELATLAAAEHMDALARRRQAAESRLRQRAADLAPLLPLIARLDRFPVETLLAVPESPEDALRGLLVLQGMSRQLEQEAEALRREQAEVARLSAQIEAEAPRLAAAEAAQGEQARGLDRQIAAARRDAHAAEGEAAEAARQAADDAARADSLRDVIARLEASRRAEQQRRQAEPRARRREAALVRPAEPASLGLGAPHGLLTAPVAGTVTRAFGEPTEAGPAEGVSYRASPAARVVSPCSGKILFAAPFRSYGLLLIVDCGAGYDFVLAGLDRLDVPVGRQVQAGEPVGAMAGWDPHTLGDRPALYLELRHDGRPVNPAPWLKARA
jgi:septal ring factor EnvC (AmiA/AmiB activator)